MKKRIFISLIALFICKGMGMSEFQNADHYIIRQIDSYCKPRTISPDVTAILNDSIITDSMSLQYMTVREFKDKLAFYESLCSYTAVNKFGFAGAYQFSSHMIRKFGQVPRKTFLTNPSIQEKAMSLACIVYIHYIYYCGYDKYIGTEIAGITITLESLMLGVHFSPTYLKNWLESNGKINQSDINVSIRLYMSKFENKGDTIKVYTLF